MLAQQSCSTSLPVLPPVTANAQTMSVMVCRAAFPRESLAASRVQDPSLGPSSLGPSSWHLSAGVQPQCLAAHYSSKQSGFTVIALTAPQAPSAYQLLFCRVFMEKESSPGVKRPLW